MKKLLLTTTAFAMTAGVAAADITLSGTSRFGVQYDGSDFSQDHRTRLNFTGSGETDDGVAFGVFSRVQIASGGTGVFSGSNIFISFEGLKLTVGNTDGAVASRVGLYNGGIGYNGSLGWGTGANLQSSFQEFASDGAGNNATLISYDIDGFGVSASMNYAGNGVEDSFEIAASYSMDGFTVGLGYQNGSGDIAASATYSMGDIAVGGVLYYQDGGDTNFRLHGSYAIDALSLRASYNRIADTNEFGVGAHYDLGGGMNVNAAAGRLGGNERLAIGANFSF